MELGPPPPRNSIDRKPEIDSLLSEIEKGRIGSNALSTLDAYVWPRVGQLITAICSCDDDHKTLLGLKYELKALLKIRQDKRVINKSIYLAPGVNLEGHKELLGLWIAETEGAKFWLQVLTELKHRGVEQILIACVDGLSGFPDAVNTAFPDARLQLCIVHMVRNALKFVPWKDYKAVTTDLKLIYRSTTEQEASLELDRFAEKWDHKYPQISKSWRAHWPNLITLFDFPADIRKVIYTTNAIESLNSVVRKSVKTRKLFPSDDAATKVVYLAIQAASKKWTMPIRNWKEAMNHFMIEFEEQLTPHI